MSAYFSIDLRDIKFQVLEYLKAKDLTAFEKYSDFEEEEFEMILEEAAKYATEVLDPINAELDKKGCKFEDGKVYFPKELKEAYESYSEAGWVALHADPEWGGQGLPSLVAAACGEMFLSGSLAFTMTPGLTRGAAELIEAFGTEEMKEKYIEKMYTGEWSGTMCLTEPQAGSAVGDTRCTAKKEGDHYFISGVKSFITSGDHDLTENIIHLVLARTEGAPSGIKGISLFLIPKYLVNDDGSLGEFNDIVCGGIEEKMGIHASSTCTLNFGENNKCHGWIIGEECKGIRYMFHMMNDARIGVGMQGAALASAGYQCSLAYSKERIQGTDIRAMKDPNAPRVQIYEHPDVKRMLMMQKAYVEAMRAILFKTAKYADFTEAAPTQEEKDKAQMMLDLMTPICKAWCSDWGFYSTTLAIQVFGGYGYCSEYPVEQYCRDAKISSIYEGTNGIQALDLLGRKVSGKGGMLFMTYVMEMNALIEENQNHAELGAMFKLLGKYKDALGEAVVEFGQRNMNKDLLYPVYHASPFLNMFGNVVGAHYLLEQALIASEKYDALCKDKGATDDEAKKKLVEEDNEVKYYFNKIQTVKFFIYNILPFNDCYLAAIKSGDRSALEAVL